MKYQIHSYENEWVMQNVLRAVDSISHKVTNTAIVERRVMIQVGKYLERDTSNKNHKRHILRLIYREVNESLKRNQREYAEHLEDLTTSDEEGQAIEYEPEDVLADINSGNMEIKETIELLAQGDRRNKMILNAWANGYTEAKEISSILADALGGNSESHRKHIQRFKKTCRTGLTAQAI